MASNTASINLETTETKADDGEQFGPGVALRRFNNRLAQFRPEGNGQHTWEERWSKRQLRETIASFRSGKLEEFDHIFTRYLPRDLPVLEAGCGLGQLVAALDARGYHIEGVDYAEETVSRIREAAPDLNVSVGDVYHLDVPSESYGGYISIGLFEHNQDGPLEGLQEVRRVLHPSGVALISIPHLNRARAKALSRVPQSEKSSTDDGLKFYQYYYSREEFAGYIREAGLQVVEEFPYGVYSGMTRDLTLGKWLGRKNFFSWQIQKRFIGICRQAPLWARWRWAHMLMFVCRRAV
jgi:SAM-dependent methyltransferase